MKCLVSLLSSGLRVRAGPGSPQAVTLKTWIGSELPSSVAIGMTARCAQRALGLASD